MPARTSRTVLEALFEGYQPTQIVMRVERGYAYVEFDSECADRVIPAFNGKSVFGRSLRVQEATFVEDLSMADPVH